MNEEIPIRNGDIPKLYNVLYTMQAVCATERKRMWQQDRLWNITQKITGMPGGHGEAKGLDASFEAICEIEEKYEAECAEYVKELKEAERILNGIPGRGMRTFVTMRYVLGMSRKEIMSRLNLKRWRYDDMCAAVEQAEDMAHVKWTEKFMVK
ncbi:MAG: DUF1492 domain-containing protein [Selenomonadaceae bacterium]|nr:DUF1492 domain-containing protein [Selenomonadaceae bacterium]